MYEMLLPYRPVRRKSYRPGRRQISLTPDNYDLLVRIAEDIDVSVPMAIVTMANFINAIDEVETDDP